MKKIKYLLLIGFISLIHPFVYASGLSHGVEALRAEEENRQKFIQGNYNHLPNTYDIFQKLGNINPRLRANEIEKEIIARSVIKNALLINNFDSLITHYIVRDDAMIVHRMAYLAISAIALCLQKQQDLSLEYLLRASDTYSRHVQFNKITKNQATLFENLVSQFFDLTKKLYPSIADELRNKQREADFKEHRLTSFEPCPERLWKHYPKFYRDILAKIKQKTNILYVIDWYMFEIGPSFDKLQRSNFSLQLLGGLKKFGLSDDINTLIRMFTLVIPEAPQRWEQIKKQGTQEINNLKASFKERLLSFYNRARSERVQKSDFLGWVAQMYYTYTWLDEDELYALVTTDADTIMMSQQINIAAQNLIYEQTFHRFEHTGKFKAFFSF